MSSPSDDFPSQTPLPQKPGIAADDALPPVEPPTTGFVLQLFFIPLLIVSLFVLSWLLFSWMAHMGSTPESYVKDLGSRKKSAWQSASSLANMLRDSRHEALKSDKDLAMKLANVLRDHLNEGRTDDHDIQLRIFICRALGEFHVIEVVDALVDAATVERAPIEIDVRRTAIEAIAVVADNMGPDEVMKNKKVLPALVQAANDRGENSDEESARGELRARAAFTLGVIGGDEACDVLAGMCSDPVPNVRFNAATGLARHQDSRCIKYLLRMLDPDNEQIVASEKDDPNGAAWKRTQVIKNGMEAAFQLMKDNQQEEHGELLTAIERIAKEDMAQIEQNKTALSLRAKEILARLKE